MSELGRVWWCFVTRRSGVVWVVWIVVGMSGNRT